MVDIFKSRSCVLLASNAHYSLICRVRQGYLQLLPVEGVWEGSMFFFFFRIFRSIFFHSDPLLLSFQILSEIVRHFLRSIYRYTIRIEKKKKREEKSPRADRK